MDKKGMVYPMVIGIVGHPGTGKTSLAAKLPGTVLHTDDLAGLADWNEIPQLLVGLVESTSGDVVIEGVQVARMLRHGWKPDLVIWCKRAWREVLPAHASLRAQINRAMADYTGLVVYP